MRAGRDVERVEPVERVESGEWRVGPGTTAVTVEDRGAAAGAGPVRLSCTDHGGEGPPLLLLHGLAGHAGEWDALAARFASTHRVIAFDARGSGASTRRPGDVTRAAHVRDVLAVAHRFGLAGEDTVLVGQSMGGLTALLTAAAHPEVCRALVLIEAGPSGPSPRLPEQIGDWLDSWPVPFPDTETAEAFFGGGPGGRAWAAGLVAGPGGLHPRVDRDVMVATVQENAQRHYWDEWDEVRCPVLVLRGENGAMKPVEADRMRARRPGTRIGVIPDAGHDAHLDNTAAVYGEMAAFFARLHA
ncbi:Pimeloyl-ACP methyl ester carboxylesterase [Streptomyces sp. MnatMP-M77]|uniref:alpha/beta fold hydrolase n=1 Tax=unclassified Streptomyces TaxID=2593676 RepID=UPI000804C332|nr:alpha/beta hydrolase [Streptomyces sp. MnatMP-M77]MYT76357.1 alpha/beta fold hydrolase [Streptomyces sp. SID8364]SBV08501.1 Pimeloyl-ACP methyl ester carboxylesterase [Streptomyces sp. MnatMP-M77]